MKLISTTCLQKEEDTGGSLCFSTFGSVNWREQQCLQFAG